VKNGELLRRAAGLVDAQIITGAELRQMMPWLENKKAPDA
jgi:hypothetical protein